MEIVDTTGHQSWNNKIGTKYGDHDELRNPLSSADFFVCSYVDGELVPTHFDRVDSYF